MFDIKSSTIRHFWRCSTYFVDLLLMCVWTYDSSTSPALLHVMRNRVEESHFRILFKHFVIEYDNWKVLKWKRDLICRYTIVCSIQTGQNKVTVFVNCTWIAINPTNNHNKTIIWR